MNYYPNYNQFYPSYNQPYNKMIQPNQQPTEQPVSQYVPQGTIFNKPIGLLGKSVDSIEVVKAMDIPLDRKRVIFSINRWNSYSNKTITTRWNK